MAAGLPVLLSPGCNLDEVEGAGAGFVVDAAVAAFAEKLRLLLTDQAMRHEMGQRARQLAEERYAWDGIAERLEDVYVRLICAKCN